MKNCEVLVSGPLLARASWPSPLKIASGSNSSANGKPGPLAPPEPLPFGSPPWMTKPWHDAVEGQAVIETRIDQPHDPRDGGGRDLGQELKDDVAEPRDRKLDVGAGVEDPRRRSPGSSW